MIGFLQPISRVFCKLVTIIDNSASTGATISGDPNLGILIVYTGKHHG
jgi:hypothetical protein